MKTAKEAAGAKPRRDGIAEWAVTILLLLFGTTTLWLLGAFAVIALLLASIGIYGLVAYSVEQRRQELGIRRALGARPSDILGLVLGEGLALTVAGVAVGLGGAFLVSRALAAMLFEVSPTDPLIFAGMALLFVAVALIASYLPARRALDVDPAVALRE